MERCLANHLQCAQRRLSDGPFHYENTSEAFRHRRSNWIDSNWTRKFIRTILKILAQREVAIPKNVLMPELHTAMANEGADLLAECMQNLSEYLRNAKPQSDENASYGNWMNRPSIDWTSWIMFTCHFSAEGNWFNGNSQLDLDDRQIYFQSVSSTLFVQASDNDVAQAQSQNHWNAKLW